MAPLTRQQLRQKRRILNVSPVVAAGVGKQYVDIDMLTQRLQGLKIDRRQRGNPADEDARRQPGGRFVRFFQGTDKALVEIGAVPLRLPQLGGVAHQRLPQRRLPLLGIAETFHPLAGLPAHQPLRAIDEVLVIKVRHPGGQLKQLALVAVITQILAQQDKIVFLQVLRQEGHQLPAHALLAEGAFARNIFQDAHEHIPDKARRQRELDIGGNPEARGQGHLQPLRHAGTLHQHHFGLKRVIQPLALDDKLHQRLENIQPV